jgi:lipopolysaccharide export system protein LptA
MTPVYRIARGLAVLPGIAAVALGAAALHAPNAYAQIGDLRLPISLDADSTNYDGKSSMLMFEGLRLSQGNIGVQADLGLASKLDFEDSVWQFSGHVVIDTENGQIHCETADLKFSGHRLLRASITGSPATFELQRTNSEDTTYAEAGKLDYDFEAGVVEFSENAVISEGGNQISSNYLVYNILEQRINAQSAGEGEPRVKITYTPRQEDLPETSPADVGAETPDEAGEPGAEDNSEPDEEPAADGAEPPEGPGAGDP